MRIGQLDTAARVVVIAELGNNHEGDVGRALELVDAAAAAGADAVKTQVFRTEAYTSPVDPARVARLKSFELSLDDHHRLAERARDAGLAFIASTFDLESASGMADQVDAFKVASGDIAFYPLLARVAATGKPLILSSGGSELPQLEQSVAYVREHGAGELAMLHCVSAYPAEPGEASLRSIPFLRDHLDVVIGYSDHVIGTTAALAAVALGARIVEKHLTLDKHLSEFRDHALSADPAELTALVEGVRALEPMLGAYAKEIQPGERAGLDAMHRSIVAARELPSGHVLSDEDLSWTRPAGGLPPGEEAQLVGKRLLRAVAAGEQLLPDFVDEA